MESMDIRDRLLKADIRHVTETLRALSEEFLIIQDFVKFEFGTKFAAYLKTRGDSKVVGRKSPLSTLVKRGRGKGKATLALERAADLKKKVLKLQRLAELNADSSRLNPLEESDDDQDDVDMEDSDPMDHEHEEDLDNNAYSSLNTNSKYDEDEAERIRSKRYPQYPSTESGAVQVKFEPTDYEDAEIVPETSAGNCDLGFDATQFLSNPIPAGCNDGVNTEVPPRPKQVKRGGRTKDKAWMEFVKVGDKWECCYCDYSIKFAQLDRLKKHLDACRRGQKKARKPRSSGIQRKHQQETRYKTDSNFNPVDNNADKSDDSLSNIPAGGGQSILVAAAPTSASDREFQNLSTID